MRPRLIPGSVDAYGIMNVVSRWCGVWVRLWQRSIESARFTASSVRRRAFITVTWPTSSSSSSSSSSSEAAAGDLYRQSV